MTNSSETVSEQLRDLADQAIGNDTQLALNRAAATMRTSEQRLKGGAALEKAEKRRKQQKDETP